jgi:PAS domain S-box-containing protein
LQLALLVRQYGVALLASSVAILISLAFRPVLLSSRSALFFVAVALSAWYGGIGPGLLATLICALAFDAIFLEPPLTLTFTFPIPLVPLGEFVLIAILITILSARLHATQDNLAANLALFDTLMASAPVGLAFLDRDFRFERLNEALAEMIGAPVEANLGRTVQEMVPRIWPTLEPLLQRVLTTEEPIVNIEVTGETLAAPGKERAWLVSYYPVRVWQRTISGIGVVVVEITERKRAEAIRARLAQEEAVRVVVERERAQLAAILERAPSGIVFVEAGTRQVLANPRASEIFGRPLIGEVGQHQYLEQIRHPDGRPLTLDELPSTHALRGETLPDQEFVIVRPDGTQVPVIGSTAPVRGPGGVIQGAVVIFQDISALKELERVREEFMAAVAHELRSPITVIKGRSQLALLRDARVEPARQAFDMIVQQADRIAQIVDDLLTVVRIRPGRRALTWERVDLSRLVHEVVARTARAYPRDQFHVDVAGPLVVDGDQTLLGDVVDRLLENAVHYSPDGAPITVIATRRDGEAVVSISDHGVGIAPERQPHVFEPFYELVPPGRPGYTGLVSLDLYLSKQIVEAHGGRIWFASTPGKGSTFSFSLRLVESAG